ncbi:hypothetical protein ACR6C2_20470 [Streptomyces sp. INA 01156]
MTEAAAGHGMTLTGTHRADLVFTDPTWQAPAARPAGVRRQPAPAPHPGSPPPDRQDPARRRRLRAEERPTPERHRDRGAGAGRLLPMLLSLTTQALVSGTPLADVIPFSATFSGEYVLLAFLVLALSEVFRRGTKLRADTEGLV